MRVLLTGMSGAGKSALVAELRRRGRLAYDADDQVADRLIAAVDRGADPGFHGRDPAA